MNKLLAITFVLSALGVVMCLPMMDNIEQYEYEGVEGSEEDGDDGQGFIDLSQYNATLFGNPDIKTGEALTEWTVDANRNPEEYGSYLEGDILIPINNGRNGLVAQTSRWPSGVIPFVIQGSFNAREMDTIERGIKEYHAKTCIRFKPRTSERDYVAIVNGKSGCWSSVGRVGGRQELNLQTPACLMKVGTFIHEMMHAVGFFHEQNRHERDNYITVKYENVMSGTEINFDKTSSSKAHGYGVPYDYGSVMHYSAYAFSRNGNPTIIPKQAVSRNIMGQRDGFSVNDIKKINNMYQCHSGYVGEGGPQVFPGSASGSGSGSEQEVNAIPQPIFPQRPPQYPAPPQYPSQPSRPVLPGLVGILGNIVSGFFPGHDEAGGDVKVQEISNKV